MSFHHGRTTRGATALVTAFAAAAFVLQLAMPSAFAAPIDGRNIDLAPNTHTYSSGSTSTTTATVLDVNGDPAVGVVVTFTESGPGAIITADGDPATAGWQVTTDVNGEAVVQTQTAVDQVGDETITGTISSAATSCGEIDGTCTNTVTATWALQAARFIDLSPATATNPTGTVHIVTATVTDVNGNPVEGALVDFTETGTGFFVLGSPVTNVATDANGEAQAFLTTVAGQTGGDETITADITDSPDPNDCAAVVDDPNTGDAAGNCTADATKTWSDVPVTTPHARTISLRLSDGLTAKGTVTVTDGFTACAASVPVKVQRHVSGHWKTLKTKTTSAIGAYHAHLNNRHGSYRALATKVTIGTDVCTKATSPTRRH